jgi:hypothetical protein
VKLSGLVTPRLEGDAEVVRRLHDEALASLQSLPAAGLVVLPDVVLRDGIPTPIAHRLGRVPKWVGVSVVRGAVLSGHVDETREGIDRSKFVHLTANGYGSTVTVDLVIL